MGRRRGCFAAWLNGGEKLWKENSKFIAGCVHGEQVFLRVATIQPTTFAWVWSGCVRPPEWPGVMKTFQENFVIIILLLSFSVGFEFGLSKKS